MRRLCWIAAAVMVLAEGAAEAQRHVDPNPPSIHSTRGAWKHVRQWTPEETRHYARWIEHIYDKKTTGTIEQRMAKVYDIILDPEMNLLEDPDFCGAGCNPQMPRGLLRQINNVIDCGKFTAFMPAYYAYRRGLPWMSNYVRSSGGDVRTAAYTIPSGAANSFTSPSLNHFFLNAIRGFISGNYRVELDSPNAGQSDTLPVAIDPDFLLPGVVNYIDGHCLLLAKVDEYGELKFLNASMTVTRDIYSYNGLNTVAGITPRGLGGEREWAGCFQGLRVNRYPIAETDARGRVTNVRRRTNEEMRAFGFSTEQYTRVQELYEHQRIEVDGLQPRSFHDFIRLRMRSVDRINPLEFLEAYAAELIDMYRFREMFVQDAWRDVLRNGPIVYPEGRANENIFQAHGRWELWSSPSSDVDRRNKYFYLGEWMDYAIRWFGIAPDFIDLAGLEQHRITTQAGLARALIAEKQRVFAEHAMEYKNSQGKLVRLTLADIEARLYRMSFDPNHPPELRWGAEFSSEEMANAPHRPTPVPGGASVPMEEAYRLQTYYRHVGLRETEMSLLRGMFTEGFPIRDKFEGAMAKWFAFDEPTSEMLAHARAETLATLPPPPPVMPAGADADAWRLREAGFDDAAPESTPAFPEAAPEEALSRTSLNVPEAAPTHDPAGEPPAYSERATQTTPRTAPSRVDSAPVRTVPRTAAPRQDRRWPDRTGRHTYTPLLANPPR